MDQDFSPLDEDYDNTDMIYTEDEDDGGERMYVTDLKHKPMEELAELAEGLNVENAAGCASRT